MKWLKNNFRSIIILLIFGVFYIAAIWRLYTSYLIDYDSSYQYSLLQHSWKEMFTLIPEDYSPPLYAVLLRLFCILFGNSLSVMRMFTIVPYLGMICLALFPVKKEFGEVCGNTCALLCGLSFAFFNYSSQIRPHMLAMFFMMGVAVYAYISHFNSEKKNYFFLIIFSVLSMYTHNVAMLGTLGIYVVLIGFSLVQKDWQKLKMGFVSGLISAVVYIPWLFVVFYQFGNVKEHYWTSKRSLWHTLYEIYLMPFFNNIPEYFILSLLQDMILFLILFAIIVLFLIRLLMKNRNKNVSNLKLSDIKFPKSFYSKINITKAVFLLMETVIPISIYLLFNTFVYPIATDRYNIILGTIIVFAVSVFVSKLLNQNAKSIANIIIAIVYIANYSMIYYKKAEWVNNDKVFEMVEKIKSFSEGKDIAFIHSHEWSLGVMSYLFPNAKQYVYDGTWTVLRTYSVFENVIDIGDFSNLPRSEDGYFFFTNAGPDQTTYAASLLEENFDDAEIISLDDFECIFCSSFDLAYVSFNDNKS